MASTDAQKAKDRGNAAFKSGAFPEAIGHYTTAILADRSDPTYLLNRAAAYLKLGKNEDAERDCTTALNLKSGNVKALFRRAQARYELQKWDDAQKDLKEALKTEPGNVTIKTELKRIDEVLSKTGQVNGKEGQNMNNGVPSVTPSTGRRVPITIIEPTTTPVPSQAAPPKRHRIPITVVEPPQKISSSSTSVTTESLTAISSRPLSSLPIANPIPTPPVQPASTMPSPADSFKAAQKARETYRPTVGGGIFRSTGQHTLLRPPSQVQEATTFLDSKPAADNGDKPSLSGPSTSHEGEVVEQDKEKPLLKTPTSLFAFTKAWDALSTSSARYDLICQIPASALPGLFKTSLEPTLLVSILETFSSKLSESRNGSPAREVIREYMTVFPAVPRFGTLLLFMSKQERELARSVCLAVGGEVPWNV